jgi:hypothetical protein
LRHLGIAPSAVMVVAAVGLLVVGNQVSATDSQQEANNSLGVGGRHCSQ